MSTVSGVASLIVTGTRGLWAMNVALLSATRFCVAALSCTNGPLAEEKTLFLYCHCSETYCLIHNRVSMYPVSLKLDDRYI